MYVLFYTFICCFALHFIVFISSVFYQTLYSLLLVSRPTASCLLAVSALILLCIFTLTSAF